MNPRKRSLGWYLAACVAAAAMSNMTTVAARTLAEVRARGMISMCANPDSLPHASNKPETPGFQVEIGPNGFLDTKPTTLTLARDVGVEGLTLTLPDSYDLETVQLAGRTLGPLFAR